MGGGNLYYPGAAVQQVHYFFDHLQMRGGEVSFTELPSIYYVSVEDQQAGWDALQVVDNLPGMTAISAKMQVGHNNYVKISFFQCVQGFYKIRMHLLPESEYCFKEL